MPAVIKLSELNSTDMVQIDFGFSGLTERHALSIIRDEWPEQRARSSACTPLGWWETSR